MYINPYRAIAEGWIKFPDWMDRDYRKKCIQPNAIDITLDNMYKLDLTTVFILTEQEKQMRPVTPLSCNNGMFEFHSGCYDVTSDFYVDIPKGVAAEIIVRSTLNRNGLFVTSGLYDSGFKGHIGFMLHNRQFDAKISQHTRIAQIKFIQSEESDIMYSGGYNHEQGQYWADMKGEIQ